MRRLYVMAGTCLLVAALGSAATDARATPAPRVHTQATALPPDVGAAARYRDDVVWALDRQVLRLFSDGTFRPRSPLTRAGWALALWRLSGQPGGAPATTAVDVPPGTPGRRAISWSLDQGHLRLSPDGRFQPSRGTTRAVAAMSLWNLAGAPTGFPASDFDDVPPTAASRAAFDWLAAGPMSDVFRRTANGLIRPRATITRAEAAMLLHRADAALGAERPNLVVILTDDQTLESMRVMPQVHQLLAQQGTTFTNAMDTFPLCCPSRATLLTGQYSHNHRVRNNVLPLGGYATLDHTNALPVWLHDAGYQTAHVGKYMNCYGSVDRRCGTGGPDVPPGWDDWFALPDPYPTNYGYMSFDTFDNGVAGHIDAGDGRYQTDVLADRAVADIQRLAGVRPFFVNIWTQAPHSGIGSTAPNAQSPAPAPAYAGTYANESLPDVPSYGEEDLSDKPGYVRGWFADHWQGASERYGLTRSYRATLEALRSVDDLVGRVVHALDDAGELDDTVIVFTSDNGLTFGEHRMKWWKVVPYEESVHVPLVIRGPGFPAGTTASQVVGNVDLAPTLIELARARAGRVMDGRSLVPLAEDPAVGAERAVLLENWPDGTSQILPHYDAVRTRNEVYIEYSGGDRELYDLDADPYQLTSVHDDPGWAGRRGQLATALRQLRGCAGRTCDVSVAPRP